MDFVTRYLAVRDYNICAANGLSVLNKICTKKKVSHCKDSLLKKKVERSNIFDFYCPLIDDWNYIVGILDSLSYKWKVKCLYLKLVCYYTGPIPLTCVC